MAGRHDQPADAGVHARAAEPEQHRDLELRLDAAPSVRRTSTTTSAARRTAPSPAVRARRRTPTRSRPPTTAASVRGRGRRRGRERVRIDLLQLEGRRRPGQNYTISGNAVGLLYPTACVGHGDRVTLQQPEHRDRRQQGRRHPGVATWRPTSLGHGGSPGPHPCTTADFVITAIPAGAYPFYVPSGVSTLPRSSAPRICHDPDDRPPGRRSRQRPTTRTPAQRDRQPDLHGHPMTRGIRFTPAPRSALRPARSPSCSRRRSRPSRTGRPTPAREAGTANTGSLTAPRKTVPAERCERHRHVRLSAASVTGGGSVLDHVERERSGLDLDGCQLVLRARHRQRHEPPTRL